MKKYGWFEIRCRMLGGSGLHSACWLLQHDPNKQEYSPFGKRGKVGDGIVEIDIFEQPGRQIAERKNTGNVHFTNDGRNEPAGNRPPRSIGSSASPLLRYLDGSHCNAKPSADERRLVRLWIEAGAVYAGTYAVLAPDAPVDGYAADHPFWQSVLHESSIKESDSP